MGRDETPVKIESRRSEIQAAMLEADNARAERGVNIDGRRYLSVKDRVEIFRKFFGLDYSIITDVICADPMVGAGVPVKAACVIRHVESGQPVASGVAMGYVGSDRYMNNSPFEVVETSAIGRALAAFGLHGGEFASANEIEKAKPAEAGRPKTADEVDKLIELVESATDSSTLMILWDEIGDSMDEEEKFELFRQAKERIDGKGCGLGSDVPDEGQEVGESS